MRREFAAAAPEPDGVLYEAEVVRWARWERLVRTPLDEWRADEGRAACAAPLTAHGLLLAARELLGENGERWTQRAAAVDARGAHVAPEGREAAAWSGAGALYAAFGPQHLATDAEIGVLVDAESALVFALPPPGDSSIVTVNDERPFAEMAAVYARAIESRSRAAASRQQSAIAPGLVSPAMARDRSGAGSRVRGVRLRDGPAPRRCPPITPGGAGRREQRAPDRAQQARPRSAGPRRHGRASGRCSPASADSIAAPAPERRTGTCRASASAPFAAAGSRRDPPRRDGAGQPARGRAMLRVRSRSGAGGGGGGSSLRRDGGRSRSRRPRPKLRLPPRRRRAFPSCRSCAGCSGFRRAGGAASARCPAAGPRPGRRGGGCSGPAAPAAEAPASAVSASGVSCRCPLAPCLPPAPEPDEREPAGGTASRAAAAGRGFHHARRPPP